MCVSETEGQEGSYACSDPYFLLLVCWNLEEHYEIGWVARCRQCSCSRDHLVEWTMVDALLWWLPINLRNQVDYREVWEQLFWFALCQHMCLVVPSTAFQEYSIDVAACGWFFLDIGNSHVVKIDKVKGHLVDSNYLFSSIVLKHACNEGLWEEQTWYPEYFGSWCLWPGFEEIHSF